MKKKIALIIAFIAIILSQNFAYSEPQAPEKFKLNLRFPANVYFTYTFTEETNVQRTYSDNTVLTYDRDLKYYFTIMSPAAPKNGFYNIFVSIDSLNYKYAEGEKIIEYNSQSETQRPPFRHRDYERISIALGRDFILNMSPYDEPIGIEGEDYEFYVYQMTGEEIGIRDSVRLRLWKKGLSMTNLAFLSKPSHNILPDEPIEKDSVWSKEINMIFDGLRFKDSVRAKIISTASRGFRIEGNSEKLIPIDEPALINGIKDEILVLDSEAEIKYSVEYNPRGYVSEFIADAVINMRIKAGNDIFKQVVSTRYIWKIDRLLSFQD